MIQNVHKDHRKRMREKFMQDGIESFQPHEVLEMLLFYSYRQRNTNEIAHRLLDRFGSLPAVFEADIKSLTEVPDVGENTAVFLKLLACVQRYYMKEKYSKEKGKKVTPDNVAEILEPLFCGYTEEVMYMISLDANCEMISLDIIGKGTVNCTTLYTREVVKKAIETKAVFVILAHNHPNGNLAPSESDKIATLELNDAFNFIHVKLLDHIIVARGDYISLARDYKLL